tara:strand:+ start:31 stop:495 length:465 start_codon:yes stop_codon:yes gene_type:complete
VPHSRRLNPTTGKVFKHGFISNNIPFVNDNMVFDGYQTSVLRKKTGCCKEIWRTIEGYKESVQYDKRRKKFLYDKIQEMVNNEKSSRGCQQCGYNKSPFALDFHHINKKTKNVSYWFKTSYEQLKKIKKEWAKCIVLCANCHRIEHHGMGNAKH